MQDERIEMNGTEKATDKEHGVWGYGCGGDPFAERPAFGILKGAKIFVTDKEVEVHLPVRLGPPFTIVVGRGRTDREAIEEAFAKRSARETAFFC
jgi:hypothetical protein